MKVGLLAVAGFALTFAEPALAQQTPSCEGPQDACQQIVNLAAGWDVAFNKKDPGALAALFTPDGIIVGEGPTISGSDAVAKTYTDLFQSGAKFSDHLTKVEQVHVAGNMGWSVGSWSDTGPDPNNNSYQGTWGNVLVNQGGAWKVRMLTWNRIEPQPKAAASAASNK